MIVNSKLFKSTSVVIVCLFLAISTFGQTETIDNSSGFGSSKPTDDIRRFLQNFNEAYKEARSISNEYRLVRVLWEDQIKDLESAEPVNQIKLDQISAKLKNHKKQEKVAQSNLKKFRKYARYLVNLNDQTLKKQQSIISTVETGYQKMPRVFPPGSVTPLDATERPAVVQTEIPEKENKPKKVKATKQPTRQNTSVTTLPRVGYATYDRSKDVNFNPPASECTYRFKGMDDFLGKEKTEVQPNLFFFHTDPELRKYMKGQEYIECTAGLANSTGGVTTLNIEVVIRSQNALREFGGLQKGNAMTIKLVNGEIVKLLSVNSDNGTFDQTTGLTTFRNQFLVQKGEESAMRETEIDKIRLVWSNGYEDYDVYEVDFMMNQLNCLYAN